MQTLYEVESNLFDDITKINKVWHIPKTQVSLLSLRQRKTRLRKIKRENNSTNIINQLYLLEKNMIGTGMNSVKIF